MLKALIIGVGNIGAMYDIDSDHVSTYAKAFSKDDGIRFDIFDVNLNFVKRVVLKYNCGFITNSEEIDYKAYDLVIVSSPTNTHHAYLQKALEANAPLVICEKPVDVDLKRLNNIAQTYKASASKVMVNYYRRFHRNIAEVKQAIRRVGNIYDCTNIVVRYQRGLHNNFSHAADLIEFIFDTSLDFRDVTIINKVFDEFTDDPTASFIFRLGNTNINIVGLQHVAFSHFDIEVYFKKQAFMLKNGCNDFEHYITPPATGTFYPKLQLHSLRKDLLENYMLEVVSYAKFLLANKNEKDNFLRSIELSKKILTLINK